MQQGNIPVTVVYLLLEYLHVGKILIIYILDLINLITCGIKFFLIITQLLLVVFII